MLRIMAFGAHPADPIWWAGGVLAKHRKKGDEVAIVALTYGERSHAPVLWERVKNKAEEEIIKEIKEEKKKELYEAAKVLGAKTFELDYGDSPLIITPDRLRKMVEIIRDFKPDIVITSWYKDPQNADHAVAGYEVWKAVHYARDLGYRTNNSPHKVSYVFYYPPVMSFGPEVGFVPDVYVDIAETIELKIEALSKFWTQKLDKESARRWVESQASIWAERVEAEYVEIFKRLWSKPQQYLP